MGVIITNETHRRLRSGDEELLTGNEQIEQLSNLLVDLRFISDRADDQTERDQAFKDLAKIAYGSRDAAWTSPTTLVTNVLRRIVWSD
jgi:hypothetical protein